MCFVFVLIVRLSRWNSKTANLATGLDVVLGVVLYVILDVVLYVIFDVIRGVVLCVILDVALAPRAASCKSRRTFFTSRSRNSTAP